MSGPTDIEVSRALNALATTPNDQKAERAEPGDGPSRGWVEAPDARRLASFGCRDGRWRRPARGAR